MIFSEDHMLTFSRLSHDRNPLHLEEDYARRSQFGRKVVYGVGAVLWLLGKWASGSHFRLLEIRASFERPLFLGEEYEVACHEEGRAVTSELRKGGVLQVRVSFRWAPWEGSGAKAEVPPPLRATPASSCAALYEGASEIVYGVERESLGKLAKNFLLSPDQVPLLQLNALAWSSYFVGMEYPGRQALFCSLKIRFSSELVSVGSLLRVALEGRKDDRFNQVFVKGHGPGVESAEITAFSRPEPVDYRVSEVRDQVGESALFAGRHFLISGASRGFGSVLAQVFALHGAKVILHYRREARAAERIQADLGEVGRRVELVQGDLGVELDCLRIAGWLVERGIRLDGLIHNASPVIPAKSFLEQTPEEFEGFVIDSVRLYSRAMRSWLPLVAKGGFIASVTSQYVSQPQPKLSHYLAAKHAIEGMTRGLAMEFKDLSFILLRPPRMLTDQTNVPFSREPAVSPIEVAQSCLKRMSALDAATNLHEIDLF